MIKVDLFTSSLEEENRVLKDKLVKAKNRAKYAPFFFKKLKVVKNSREKKIDTDHKEKLISEVGSSITYGFGTYKITDVRVFDFGGVDFVVFVSDEKDYFFINHKGYVHRVTFDQYMMIESISYLNRIYSFEEIKVFQSSLFMSTGSSDNYLEYNSEIGEISRVSDFNIKGVMPNGILFVEETRGGIVFEFVDRIFFYNNKKKICYERQKDGIENVDIDSISLFEENIACFDCCKKGYALYGLNEKVYIQGFIDYERINKNIYKLDYGSYFTIFNTKTFQEFRVEEDFLHDLSEDVLVIKKPAKIFESSGCFKRFDIQNWECLDREWVSS